MINISFVTIHEVLSNCMRLQRYHDSRYGVLGNRTYEDSLSVPWLPEALATCLRILITQRRTCGMP